MRARNNCRMEYNRNAVAVASLLKLADEFLLLSSSEALVKIYYETFETADDVSELVGIEQIILRDIEFGSQYDNIEELLSRLIDEFRVSLWPADPEPHQIVYH